MGEGSCCEQVAGSGVCFLDGSKGRDLRNLVSAILVNWRWIVIVRLFESDVAGLVEAVNISSSIDRKSVV